METTGSAIASANRANDERNVSRTAILVVMCLIVVIFIIVIVSTVAITVSRIKRRAKKTKVPLVDTQYAQGQRLYPKGRVPDAVLEALGIVRVPVSNFPPVDLLMNFITPDLAQELIAVSQGKGLVDGGATTHIILTQEDAYQVQQVIDLATKVAGVPKQYLEPCVLEVHRPPELASSSSSLTMSLDGDACHDFLTNETVNRATLRRQGQRTITIRLFLNNVTEVQGGTETLTALCHTTRPLAGMAILWHNVSPEGHRDARTTFSMQPMKYGVKYVLRVRFRDKPQTDGGGAPIGSCPSCCGTWRRSQYGSS